MQEAQTFAIRHTVHHKPQMYTGNLRPMGAAPITFVCSYSYGGDCVAIEQYVIRSFRIALQNYTKFFDFHLLNCKNHIKCDGIMQISCSDCSYWQKID